MGVFSSGQSRGTRLVNHMTVKMLCILPKAMQFYELSDIKENGPIKDPISSAKKGDITASFLVCLYLHFATIF